MILRGRHVVLEPLTLDHVDEMVEATSEDPSLYQWNVVPRSHNEARVYVEAAIDRADMIPFAIRWDGRLVGSTRFCRVERWEGSQTPTVCEIGYTWLAASAIRTVVNTDAKRTLLCHAFDEWKVLRVSIITDVRNEPSRRAIERLGATLEGVIRAERLAVDGTVRDTARYSIVRDEWPAVKALLESL
ncbi:MAG TPA: GNAT family protein [Acidimicrobiales bacterium]|nr:GNAT family protein [Acidimicrobiales bacterium]